MAESKSESEPSQPSHMNLILNLFNSVGYVDANRNDFSLFDKLIDGLSWCISSANPLNPTTKLDTAEDIEDALKSVGCPHALQATEIEDLDYIAIYPAVQWLVSVIKTKQHNNGHVHERKAAVLNELQLLKERINETSVDSMVQQLASLLKTSKELAGKLRESVSLKRQLDDMPIAEEVVQYEQRFSELNVHIQDRLQRTRKYYATYNALLEIKDLMLKEMSLLNSFDSQFQDAIRNPAGRTKLIDSMEAILEGTRQKLEKVQPGLQVERKTFDTLREQYTAAIANQRRRASLLKAFEEERRKNERLKAELVTEAVSPQFF